MSVRGIYRARCRYFGDNTVDEGNIGLLCGLTAAIEESRAPDYRRFTCLCPHQGKSNYLLDAAIAQNADALEGGDNFVTGL